jgi:uncharacterized protein (TIGR02453 family)
MSERHFSPALFKFQRDLAANNNRDWFQANKERYIAEVQDPALNFIVDFGPHLLAISPCFRSDPRRNGGSLHRVYRDIRFSRDKSPYKVWTGIQFRHEKGKGAHSPCFYLHLQPGACFVGVGLWRPDNPSLKLIRDAVAARPDRWKAVVENKGFAGIFKMDGESLVRPPRGYDPDHPLIEVLKLKDFIATAPLAQKQVTSVSFLDDYAGICRAGSGLVRFICEALGQQY